MKRNRSCDLEDDHWLMCPFTIQVNGGCVRCPRSRCEKQRYKMESDQWNFFNSNPNASTSPFSASVEWRWYARFYFFTTNEYRWGNLFCEESNLHFVHYRSAPTFLDIVSRTDRFVNKLNKLCFIPIIDHYECKSRSLVNDESKSCVFHVEPNSEVFLAHWTVE